jgi:thiamine biosynthesis protein ThiS
MPSSDTETIEIVVNGQKQSAPAALDLHGLLAHLKIEPDRVAIELNREIVRRTLWNSTTIRSGDHLEIVQFVGGG